jgi:hypothetical protein
MNDVDLARVRAYEVVLSRLIERAGLTPADVADIKRRCATGTEDSSAHDAVDRLFVNAGVY